jgi:stage III sporulation protein AA
MSTKEVIMSYCSSEIKRIFERIDDETFKGFEQVRLRVKKPLTISFKGKEMYISQNGKTTNSIMDAYRVSAEDISKTLNLISGYSMYAFEEMLKNGFITLPMGHRVGICGTAVIENKQIKTIKNINALNIRISHQILDCGLKILRQVYDFNCMIISPPGFGKTTLLRDLVRLISDGRHLPSKTVSIIDERSEIAGCYKGEPQNDIGLHTDVLDACPKSMGMRLMLRAMSPQIIAVDEIGGIDEISSIIGIATAGVKFICTVHGDSIDDLQARDEFRELLIKKIFKRFIILGKQAKILSILDDDYREIVR